MEFPVPQNSGGEMIRIPTTEPEAALDFCRSLAKVLKEHPQAFAGGHDVQEDKTPEVSLVIPLFNEEGNLPPLYSRIDEVFRGLGISLEFVFVNDGSKDGTARLLDELTEKDPRVCFVEFARNFGHQVAISAGLEHTQGKAVIIMDGDLQDPPEVLPQFIAKWREGYDVVYAIRENRKEWWPKRLAYALFYRILQYVSQIEIPLDAGDFCIMDRRVVDHLVMIPERHRFLRGIRSWLGFRQIGLPYERQARHSGKPKYTLKSLFFLALDGMLSFSYMPLRTIVLVGMVISAFSIGLAIFYILKKALFTLNPPGFATIAVAVFFMAGIQLVTIGVMGEYVARISDEVKRRPLYIASRVVRGKTASKS
jgi:glycosyltransferase involved in cell wall biosynthesis